MRLEVCFMNSMRAEDFGHLGATRTSLLFGASDHLHIWITQRDIWIIRRILHKTVHIDIGKIVFFLKMFLSLPWLHEKGLCVTLSFKFVAMMRNFSFLFRAENMWEESNAAEPNANRVCSESKKKKAAFTPNLMLQRFPFIQTTQTRTRN